MSDVGISWKGVRFHKPHKYGRVSALYTDTLLQKQTHTVYILCVVLVTVMASTATVVNRTARNPFVLR